MNPIGNHHHVNIPSASNTQSTQPLPQNLPCQDLLDVLSTCFLYQWPNGAKGALTTISCSMLHLIFISIMNPIGNHHHVNIPSASNTQSTQPLPQNLPCQDLLDDGRREEYLELCVPLHKASMRGDWKAAKNILGKKEDLIKSSINRNNETALHVAVSRGHRAFVKNLVSLMEKKDLELQDNNSYTAFCLAASNGDIKMAEILLKENKAPIDIPTDQGMMPLHIALSTRRRDMVEFLYVNSKSMLGDFWTPENQICFLLACVKADCYDIALRVVKDQPELALVGGSVLRVLAQKPEAFKSNVIVSTMRRLFSILYPNSFMLNCNVRPALTLLRFILTNIAKLHWTEIQAIMRGPSEPIKEENTTTLGVEKPIDARSSSVLFSAAEAGNVDFIVEVIEQYPELLQEKNDINRSIFHVAVSHRHKKIFGLLYEIGSSRDSIVTLEDVHGNNMLHLVGICSNSSNGYSSEYIPGAAYEMQQELVWFKEVESMLPLSLREKKNACGHTPREEFTNHHKHLVTDGEKWLKETGAQLMVVAALLAAMSFAATITFAGGYNQDTGYPIFSKKDVFPQFMNYCTFAFLSSSTSIINVLSLLTSRYAEEDFEKSLPERLMFSILTLLLSIADILLRVVKDQPELALDGVRVLRVLAQKPEAFKSKNNSCFNNEATVFYFISKFFYVELQCASSLDIAKIYSF
ncbi:Ankyrin repeat-containing protein [Artemisia annua]|uniref:Ankyrin repeat-containing protein n=1 Tax=Artemisia annua TaxID=35608 RepID=A0A2U1NNA2_ARTAN|nr:Ankyrin repeat-containing protein [Artemisia annua]